MYVFICICLHFHVVAMDPERQKRKEEIEKALGFIQYVIWPLSCYLMNPQIACLHNDFIFWFRRSSLPFPDPDGYEVGVSLFLSVYVFTV